MKRYIFLMVCLLIFSRCMGQVKNTSYVTRSGEKVLRLESVLPVDMKTAWALFTTDAGLKKWIAPQAHINLAVGGSIVTNYDKDKPLSDASSITLPIINYVDDEMITFKVNLNDNFDKTAQAEDKNLQEVVMFKQIGPNQTQIISLMMGWGKGPTWDKTYNFFAKGNEWTYNELLKNYK
ncbi:MAG: SRPBCC domain-containing protein [Sphingobacteriales bacterium]